MKLLCSLFLSSLLVACTYSVTADDNLLKARNLWSQIDPANYDYLLTQRCYCLQAYQQPMRVSVRTGVVASAVYTNKQAVVEGMDASGMVHTKILKSLKTVDDWFDYLEKGQLEGYFKLDARFNPELGYPEQIISDRRKEVADDEMEIMISDLVIIN